MCDTNIIMWNFFDKRLEYIWEGRDKVFITSIKVSSDNRYLIASSSDKTVRILNILDRKQISELEGHTS